MKRMRLKLIVAMALTVMTFAACDKEEAVFVDNTTSVSDNLIRVSTDGGITRGGYTTSNLSEFGFFVNTPGKPDHTYNNVRMIKRNDGEWVRKDSLGMQWANATTPVDIVAYAPYQKYKPYTTTSQIPVSVNADQRLEENLIASDFIAMKWKNFLPWKDEKSGMVPVKFKHLMSQLKLRIYYVEELNIEGNGSPIADLKLTGPIRLNGICNLSQSSLAVTAASSENLDIYPFQVEFDPQQRFIAYEAILIPQTVVILLKMKVVGPYPRDHIYILDMRMESGHVYTIDLLLKKDSIERILKND